jgi:peptidoglycan/xylan/chitin deacetylase (PgdA/CDA1 family)
MPRLAGLTSLVNCSELSFQAIAIGHGGRNGNMRLGKIRVRQLMNLPTAVIGLLMASIAAAQADNCPRKGALGTSRILKVDAATTPRVGLKIYPQTLPLADHEVVLTFDDGPWPPTTPHLLKTLAHECVRATFFLIGKPASEHPDLVREIAAGGHTIGTHTWLHRSLKQMPFDEAKEEIDHGISAVEEALHGVATTTPSTPFFRFPNFETTPALLALLQSRGIIVFGTDLWARDWDPMTPEQELKRLTDRLRIAGRGIILLHDPKAHTAAMLPAFLYYLKKHHYRVVQVVPDKPDAKSDDDL